jgi:hypothetical protein
MKKLVVTLVPAFCCLLLAPAGLALSVDCGWAAGTTTIPGTGTAKSVAP